MIGNDAAGKTLLADLNRSGVNTSGILVDPKRPTTTKSRIVAHGKQMLRLDNESRTPLPSGIEDRLADWVSQRVLEVDACIVSDYAKGVVTRQLARHCVSSAHELGKVLIVDPKGIDYRKYAGATLIKPNVQDVERLLAREIRDETDLIEGVRRVWQLVDGSAVLITRGPLGMYLFQSGSDPRSFSTCARGVYDVTGAGDTVAAALTVGLASGATLEWCIQLANVAAGVAVGKFGTAVVTVDELLREISS